VKLIQAMKYTVIFMILLVTVRSIRNQEFCHGGNVFSCSTEMAKKIYASRSLWSNAEQLQLFSTRCQLTLGRHFFLRQRRRKGKLSCPSLSTVQGDSWNRPSQKDAIEQSVIGYIQKGVHHDFLTTSLLQEQMKVIKTEDRL
jgi:hypothetical protein